MRGGVPFHGQLVPFMAKRTVLTKGTGTGGYNGEVTQKSPPRYGPTHVLRQGCDVCIRAPECRCYGVGAPNTDVPCAGVVPSPDWPNEPEPPPPLAAPARKGDGCWLAFANAEKPVPVPMELVVFEVSEAPAPNAVGVVSAKALKVPVAGLMTDDVTG